MTSFVKTEGLPSCDVSFDLLNKLEKYLLDDIIKITGISNRCFEKSYSVLIIDKYGSETLKSINDYFVTVFDDSTERIRLSMSLSYSYSGVESHYMDEHKITEINREDVEKIMKIKESIPRINVSIDFDNQTRGKDLRVEYQGKNARGNALLLTDTLKRLCSSFKNNNKLYHPPVVIQAAIFISYYIILVIGVLLLIVLIRGNREAISHAVYIISLFFILLLYSTLAKKTHPYYSFDTRKNAYYKKWNNWFLYTVITYFALNIIMVMIKKYF